MQGKSKGVNQRLKSAENANNQKIRINTVIMGEPAAWLNE